MNARLFSKQLTSVNKPQLPCAMFLIGQVLRQKPFRNRRPKISRLLSLADSLDEQIRREGLQTTLSYRSNLVFVQPRAMEAKEVARRELLIADRENMVAH